MWIGVHLAACLIICLAQATEVKLLSDDGGVYGVCNQRFSSRPDNHTHVTLMAVMLRLLRLLL